MAAAADYSCLVNRADSSGRTGKEPDMTMEQLKIVVAASGQTGCDIETANFEPVDARNRFTLK
jgi:hypothetical protein